MKIIYVTGADSNYFLSLGILLQAFKENAPKKKLWVCDFGLDREQRNFLDERGVLLRRPDLLSKHLHPWMYKASIASYLDDLSWDVIVWLDCDAFPVGPISLEVNAIVSSFGDQNGWVALCQGKIGNNWAIATSQITRNYFNIPPDYPYFNSGVWIIKSKKVISLWAEEIINAPKIGMYEQDTFNYLLFHHKIKIKKLTPEKWNVTHESLHTLHINSEGKISLNHQPVLIVHVTGDYYYQKISLGSFNGYIRTLSNHVVQSKQFQLLKNWLLSSHIQ